MGIFSVYMKHNGMCSSPYPYLYLAISKMWCWPWGKEILRKLSLFYSIVYYYNGAQRYERFLQVVDCIGLWSCLVKLSIIQAPLYLWSSWCYIHCNFCGSVFFFTFWWAEPGGIGPWPGWLTIVLHCYDTVGWVIQPVKSFPKWRTSTMCRVGC